MTTARDARTTTSTEDLARCTGAELLAALAADGAAPTPGLGPGELVAALLALRLQQGQPVLGDGVLELLPEGFGFLRSAALDYAPSPHDPFVSPSQVRSVNLQPGHRLTGPLRAPRGNERFFALAHVASVHGDEPSVLSARLAFAARTPIAGTQRLELGGAEPAHRALQELAPWCRGHRVLAVVPTPDAGAPLLAGLASSLRAGSPDLHLSLCALEQRPERLTALRQRFAADQRAVVVGSTFAEPPARHTALADLVLARALRDVEAGHDVVLLFDSLTALARASHRAAPASGRWLCPGLDADAVLSGKRLFAAARACAEGGSLTVIAIAVADPDRGPDSTVLAEFRHCGNSELVLDTARTGNGAQFPYDPVATRSRPEDEVRPPAARAAAERLRHQLAADAARDRIAGAGPAAT